MSVNHDTARTARSVDHAGEYDIVVNDEEQYSIWRAGSEPPAGWRRAGMRGTQADCLARVREIWTDLRPLSARGSAAEHDPRVAAVSDATDATWYVGPRFAAQAEARPDDDAVRSGAERLTYGELRDAARRVTGWLRARGVGPGRRVGLCAERGTDLMIGLLGILNAGAAYVPLDAAYPVDALRFMARDAGVALTLVSAGTADAVSRIGLPSARITRARDEGLAVDDERVAASTPAYVIYTSGSTGRPKGTLVSHGGLANYLAWIVETLGGAAGEPIGPVPLHSGITFDMAVTSLFVPITTGGTLVMMPEGPRMEPLQQVVRSDARWAFVKLTPSHLAALGEWLQPDRARAAIGTLIVGGEQLTGEMLARWRDCFPGVRVINEYGPTETVVGSVAYDLPASETSGVVPIGQPIARTSIAIVDEGGQPVEGDEAGELYIGGAGVAHGYIGRPDLTASRFVPDAFGSRPGARCYRTGDRVRRRASGDLEFLGRVDHQVKLRGYRIELGEIDAIVRAAPNVLDAATLVQGEGSADARLVAYVRVAAPSEAVADAVRRHLRGRLPAHMIPLVQLVAAWPLTPSGKVDRAALRELVPVS